MPGRENEVVNCGRWRIGEKEYVVKLEVRKGEMASLIEKVALGGQQRVGEGLLLHLEEVSSTSSSR